MDVKPSYKHTEVGLIPEDWNVVTVGSVASFKSGDSINVAALRQESSDTPVPVYGGNGIAGYTTEALVREATVVIGRVGQKCGEVYLTQGPAWISDNALYPRRYSRTVDIGFLALALRTAGLNDIKNRNDLPLITQSILHSVQVPVPSRRVEQAAIAEALSDANALIESLEQLLAKKRQLKQGAMQELLTGKKRLPGFSGEWEVKRLGDVLTIAHGKNQRAVADENGAYPILASGGQIGTASRYLYDKPSVLIGRKGTIDEPRFMDTPFWTVDTLFYSIVHEPHIAKFLYYQFCLVDWTQHNEASGVPSLNAGTIERIEVAVPRHQEQTAIAAILSDMDTAIAALGAKLVKARAIKQGMMQALLTGAIRLPIDAERTTTRT